MSSIIKLTLCSNSSAAAEDHNSSGGISSETARRQAKIVTGRKYFALPESCLWIMSRTSLSHSSVHLVTNSLRRWISPANPSFSGRSQTDTSAVEVLWLNCVLQQVHC